MKVFFILVAAFAPLFAFAGDISDIEITESKLLARESELQLKVGGKSVTVMCEKKFARDPVITVTVDYIPVKKFQRFQVINMTQPRRAEIHGIASEVDCLAELVELKVELDKSSKSGFVINNDLDGDLPLFFVNAAGMYASQLKAAAIAFAPSLGN